MKNIKSKWYIMLKRFEDNPIYTLLFTYGCLMCFTPAFAMITGIAVQPAAGIIFSVGIVLLVFSLFKIFLVEK